MTNLTKSRLNPKTSSHKALYKHCKKGYCPLQQLLHPGPATDTQLKQYHQGACAIHCTEPARLAIGLMPCRQHPLLAAPTGGQKPHGFFMHAHCTNDAQCWHERYPPQSQILAQQPLQLCLLPAHCTTMSVSNTSFTIHRGQS